MCVQFVTGISEIPPYKHDGLTENKLTVQMFWIPYLQLITVKVWFDVFSTVHHSIELFH